MFYRKICSQSIIQSESFSATDNKCEEYLIQITNTFTRVQIPLHGKKTIDILLSRHNKIFSSLK